MDGRLITNDKKMITKNIYYYLSAAALFILLKFGFASVGTESLSVLLAPVNKMVELVTGSNAFYLQGTGYSHQKLNIIIDKSCSGYNFFLLTFLMLTIHAVPFFSRTIHKLAVLPFSLLIAYVLTLFVNTTRIVASIYFQKQLTNVLPLSPSVIHESIGVISNLSFLIAIYYFTDKLLTNNKYTHAQPA